MGNLEQNKRLTLAFIDAMQRGDADAALETFESARTIEFVVTQGKALAYWSLGRTDDYNAALDELRGSVGDEAFSGLRARPEDFLASAYAWVGRHDDAFRILDELIDPPESQAPERWNSDPLLNSLHDDPRWAQLLERDGLAPHQVESLEVQRRIPGPPSIPGSRSDVTLRAR